MALDWIIQIKDVICIRILDPDIVPHIGFLDVEELITELVNKEDIYSIHRARFVARRTDPQNINSVSSNGICQQIRLIQKIWNTLLCAVKRNIARPHLLAVWMA
ncbi:hypothetical protein AVEN_222324-1 [Araneus ventricosus]|uniref:Uncharacterized protein n=1 Tax=Araneus ventricosus TaxID=182803 RepID=A0A4Y2EVQ0_ARAVE|nr:hypothetical protein AVEN_222324-1 [Araneus ventricosus]